MPPYRYTRLPEGSVRLLRLLPHPDEHSDVDCRLFICSLLNSESAHPYEALSYVWGSEDNSRSILLDNCDFRVRENLHAALSHLRDRFIERIIWIDAICINQEDEEEKGQQVQSMAKIYAKASRVIVWLGETNDDEDGALEKLRIAADEESPERLVDGPTEQAILTLLGRPWFQRIWVLQEVAAARSVLIKCGLAEIDGYAFCSGLSALRLPYETCPDLQSLVRPVAYLMRRAVFRPRYKPSTSGRFSLNILPLSELVDMYHTRKATERHDKIFALLGMSSDDPTAAGLMANYQTSWREVFQKFVKLSLSGHMSVETWDDKEMAVIRGKGSVLGEISSVERDIARNDRQSVYITWKNAHLDTNGEPGSSWSFQAPAKPIQVGDAVCLLQGALRPSIIRPYKDYSAVITIAVPVPDHVQKWPITSFPTDFLLVWDWDDSQSNPQNAADYEYFMSSRGVPKNCSKTELQDYLDKGTRLRNVGLLLHSLERYEEAGEGLGKAVEAYETALKSVNNVDLTHPGHSSSTQADVGLLAVTLNLLIENKNGWAPLARAAANGSEAVAKLLLDAGQADPNAKDQDGWMPLSRAAANGHKAVTKLLLESGKVDPNVNHEGTGQTPLSQAAENGHEAVTKLLLETAEVDLDAKDRYGRTPLWWAAENGHEVVIKLLLDTGKVDPNTKAYGGRTSLSRAAANGHEAVVKLLLDTGVVEPDAQDRDGRTPLLWAVRHKHVAVVKLLLDTGMVDPNAKDMDGETPLVLAASIGSEAVTKLLLGTGKVDPDLKDDLKGLTPLAWATDLGREAVVKLLLDTGEVDLNTRDHRERTLLWRAVEGGSEPVAKLLLNTGQFDPDDKDRFGMTLLSHAVGSGHKAVVKLLLDTGQVDADAKDDTGRTPLLWASMTGRKEIVKLLLDTGKVDPNVKDDKGWTPILLAVKKGHEAIAKPLLDTGKVDPNSKDQRGQTLLWLAVENGHEAIVKLLLDTGKVDYNAENQHRQTLLWLAVEKGHEEVAKLLQSRS